MNKFNFCKFNNILDKKILFYFYFRLLKLQKDKFILFNFPEFFFKDYYSLYLLEIYFKYLKYKSISSNFLRKSSLNFLFLNSNFFKFRIDSVTFFILGKYCYFINFFYIILIFLWQNL